VDNLAYKYRSLIVIALLLIGLKIPFISLFGLIVMWKWTNWPRWIKLIISIPLILVFIGLLFVINYLFVLRPFQIKGDAMSPTYTNGEYLLTNVLFTRASVQREDVIIFISPQDPTKNLIKRVVAVPGEKVMLQDGNVYINDQILDENKYLPSGVKTYGNSFLADGQTVEVPTDYYFVMSDNRSNILDSRSLGFIPKTNIVGKPFFCYWNCK